MEYRGKQIKAIEIYDSSDNDRIIAIICDECNTLQNGFKIRIINKLEEVIHE